MKVPVLVCTGTADSMIEWMHSEEIVKEMNAAGEGEEADGEKARLKVFEGAGHVLQWECYEEYTEMVEEYFKEAEEKLGRGGALGQ